MLNSEGVNFFLCGSKRDAKRIQNGSHLILGEVPPQIPFSYCLRYPLENTTKNYFTGRIVDNADNYYLPHNEDFKTSNFSSDGNINYFYIFLPVEEFETKKKVRKNKNKQIKKNNLKLKLY